MSGSAVFDESGEIVAIHALGFSSEGEQNFAIRIDKLTELIDWVSTGTVREIPLAARPPAQVPPWDLFEDNLSSSLCDVVNGDNVELVVLHDSSQFVIVNGPDEVLEDSFVDVNGDVFFDGFDLPFGFIDFFEDGDGFRTMWWVAVTGEVYGIDDITGDIFLTDLFPSNYIDVRCDACPLWDDPAVCGG